MRFSAIAGAALLAASAFAQFPLNPTPARVVGHRQLLLTTANPNLVEGRELYGPQGVAVDTSATPPVLYVSDTGNHRVLAWKKRGAVRKRRPGRHHHRPERRVDDVCPRPRHRVLRRPEQPHRPRRAQRRPLRGGFGKQPHPALPQGGHGPRRPVSRPRHRPAQLQLAPAEPGRCEPHGADAVPGRFERPLPRPPGLRCRRQPLGHGPRQSPCAALPGRGPGHAHPTAPPPT